MALPAENEAPDEAAHINMINFLKNQKRVPVFNREEKLPALFFDQKMLSGAYYSMAYNSPLSYLFYLPFTKNKFEDNSKAGVLPLRAVSAALVALFAVLLFLSLAKLRPKEITSAAAAAIFISLIPQVIFSAGYVNIEPVGLFFAGLAFYFLARLITQQKNNFGDFFLLGLTLGFLALCKSNYLILVLALGAIALYKIFASEEKTAVKIRNLLFLALPFLALNLWWWIRNWQLYGDPLIFSHIQKLIQETAPAWFAPPAKSGYNILTILFKPEFARYSYPGLFAVLGGANIFLPWWFYLIFYLIVAAAIIRAVFLAFCQRQDRVVVTWLIVVLIINLAIFAEKNLYDFSPQGRHFFPMLILLAWLIFLGISGIKSSLARFVIVLFLPLFAVFASLSSLWLLVDSYYVKGTAYAMAGNFDKIVEGFRWRELGVENYRNLVAFIFIDNTRFFSAYFVLAYFLLFLILLGWIIKIIVGRNNDTSKKVDV